MKRALPFVLFLACGPAPASKTAPMPDRAAIACGGDPVAKESGSRSSLGSDLEGLPISRIDVQGNRLIDASTIAAGSGLQIGAKLSHDAVASAIRKLYESGELEDVEVFVQHEGAGVIVTMMVRERPRVAEIFAPGIPDATKLEMAKWMGIEHGKPFDAAELYAQRQNIAAGMKEKGASFDVRTHVLKDNQIDVCILVKN